MKRELRRLGERPQKDQQQRRHVHWVGLNCIAVLQNHGQIVGPNDIAQQQHATNHRKATHSCYGQRHTRTLAPRLKVFPIAYQQE